MFLDKFFGKKNTQTDFQQAIELLKKSAKSGNGEARQILNFYCSIQLRQLSPLRDRLAASSSDKILNKVVQDIKKSKNTNNRKVKAKKPKK